MIVFTYQEMNPEVLQFELNIKGRGTANIVSILLAVETTMEAVLHAAVYSLSRRRIGQNDRRRRTAAWYSL